MKKKLKPAGITEGVSEAIIFVQAFFLLTFGVASLMATSAISSSAFISKDTNCDEVTKIIHNFEMVGSSIVIFSIIVTIAISIRTFRTVQTKFKKKPRRKS